MLLKPSLSSTNFQFFGGFFGVWLLVDLPENICDGFGTYVLQQ